jgi:dihydroorotate dehydrogenase electron transfer subunit
MSRDGSVARDEPAIVVRSQFPADGLCRLTLEAPRTAGLCEPGQFAMLETSPGTLPVTRRPLTFSECDPAAGTVTFLFDVVGAGTRLLSAAGRGSTVRMLAPLGRGYDTKPGRWLLVAGGLGAAGFPFLLSRIGDAVVLAGAGTSRTLCSCPEGTRFATEDGSTGMHGLVTELLAGLDWDGFDCAAVCGPAAMIAAVVRGAPQEARSRIQVSMESLMGCGWGVCGGCPVPSASGGYHSCCKDGPVFPAGDIDWERVV